MRLPRLIRSFLTTSAVLAAVVGLSGSGLVAAGRADAGRPAERAPASADLTTVPFRVTGELPIYPKALWRPGFSGPAVRKVEARLVQLKLLDAQYQDESFGTTTRTAVRKFQQSKGIPPLGYVDQFTWDRLRAATHEPTQQELFPPAPVVNGKRLDQRCATGRVLCIDKTSRKLRYVVNGKVLLSTDVRFGAKATRTREGQFSVGWKSRNHVSKLYDSKMPFAMFFSGGRPCTTRPTSPLAATTVPRTAV